MQRKIASLQVIRFVAASLVILHHGWEAVVGDQDPAPLATIGPMGVDIFFVLSGYIMATSAAGSRPLDFLYRRVSRIVPLYYLLTAAFMGELALVGRLNWAAAPTSFLLMPLGAFPYLTGAWTLFYEMLFYGAFAVVLALPRGGLAAVLAAMAGALAGAQLGVKALAFVGDPIVLEFVAGVLVAQAPAPSRRWAWTALGVSLALFALLAGLPPLEHGWRRPLLMIWPSALLIYGAAHLSASGRLWSRLAYLGDASFAAYLAHQFPMSLARPLRALIPEPAGLMAMFAASWGLAVLVHEAVERPLLKLLRPRPAAIPARQPA